MKNPLEQPRPDGLIDQIRAYARDIAFLVLSGDCEATITKPRTGTGATVPYWTHPDATFTDNVINFQKKWGSDREHKVPSLDLLTSFGYMSMVVENHNSPVYDMEQRQVPGIQPIRLYTLSEKAFALLEQPIKPPEIFISYLRIQRSDFALLVEARLRMKGTDGIFIDKDIRAGEDWHEEAVDKIEHCDTFIILIGPATLESEAIQKEIRCAVRFERAIIPIWHS